MKQIHQELKKLTATPRTSTVPPRTQQNVSNFSVQRPETQVTSSAEETPPHPSLRPKTGDPIPPTPQTGVTTGNSRPSWHRPPSNVRQQPLSCWTCGLPGHLSRDCIQQTAKFVKYILSQSDGSSWFEEGWNIQCIREAEVSRERSFLSCGQRM